MKRGCLFPRPNHGGCHTWPDSHSPVPRGISLWFSKGGSGASSIHNTCFIQKASSRTHSRPESETQGVDPAVCVVTRPPGDSDAHPSLRTSAPRVPYCQRVQETSRPCLRAQLCPSLQVELSLESSSKLNLPTLTPDPLWSVPLLFGTLPSSVPHPRPDSLSLFYVLLCVFPFFTRRE